MKVVFLQRNFVDGKIGAMIFFLTKRLQIRQNFGALFGSFQLFFWGGGGPRELPKSNQPKFPHPLHLPFTKPDLPMIPRTVQRPD